MKNKKKYKCKDCGCKEFISNPNQYDIFKNKDGKLIFIRTESFDDMLELFCRNCSEKLDFKIEDIKY